MASRSLSLSICQSCLRAGLRTRPASLQQLRLIRRSPLEEQQRAQRSLQSPYRTSFSTSASPRRALDSPPATGGSKPIVLEQPDKFRPPSHPQRLNTRRRFQPGAYNQGTTRSEREQQKTRSYPHTFPNQGTFMHWFLTNRMIHLWITMGTLFLLASISLTQTFFKTSPYAHLIPPISTLPFHPISYIRESLSVIRLHIDYTTEQAEASRQRKVLDAQKRRLYRRAHGMEDLNAEEEEGIDVRGIAPWDDGLTNKERERGGREEVMTGRDVIAMGGKVGDDVAQFAREAKEKKEKGMEVAAVAPNGADGAKTSGAETDVPPQQPQRKRKLYFGIW
ncbi:uncharacterized protein A1O9_08948 [Exophiala aquamarina CBS 119918]|uniref:Uncharacterized protein n=1 Tax=Exophiala aquamarina CBS 119918 TaxID=1182545 RepID=A0A072P5E7_9EURO|nr:uncharacterized protein A1O9_08948 [Exophiala aquamarina CBS 119918]KEF55294.1 hypothetical protein A1O9_08948 [Exophiala aquamarina CBS 119918]